MSYCSSGALVKMQIVILGVWDETPGSCNVYELSRHADTAGVPTTPGVVRIKYLVVPPSPFPHM